MSRYIRTKDGIYELKDNCKYGDLIKTIGLDNFHSQNYKQSDNLDELCDGFYIDFVNYKGFDKDKIGEPYTFEEFRDCFMTYREYEGKQYTHCEGYGFIKTDKGLIYVAKMNEDGELVLI